MVLAPQVTEYSGYGGGAAEVRLHLVEFFRELSPTGDCPGRDRGDVSVQNKSGAALPGFPIARARGSAGGLQSSGGSRSQSRTCRVPDPSPARVLPQVRRAPQSLRPAAARASAQGAFVGPTGTSTLAGRRPRLLSPGVPAPAAQNEWAQAPHLAPPTPPRPRGPAWDARGTGGRPALTFRARSAGFGFSCSSSTTVAAAEPGRVREGPPHFLPAAAARSAPPPPCSAGAGVPSARGGGGKEPGDAGGGLLWGAGTKAGSGGLWGRSWGDRELFAGILKARRSSVEEGMRERGESVGGAGPLSRRGRREGRAEGEGVCGGGREGRLLCCWHLGLQLQPRPRPQWGYCTSPTGPHLAPGRGRGARGVPPAPPPAGGRGRGGLNRPTRAWPTQAWGKASALDDVIGA